MKWSPEGWEQNVERLVNQCADKVILELEEVVMKRLREAGETVIQGLFEAPARIAFSGIEQRDVFVEDKEDPKSIPGVVKESSQVNEVRDFSKAGYAPLANEEVLYAFGIIQIHQEGIDDLLGMEDRPCCIVGNGNLGMVVCPVPRREYDEESLHLYMEDMAWVESHARRHEETLLIVMEGRSVIPLPFCTIFTDQENIKRQLAQNAEEILDNLQRLGNHKEMHVKLLVNRKRFLEKLHEELPYSGGESGGGYFQKRLWEKKIAEEMERVMDDYGESLYQVLNNMAAEVILLDKAGVVAPEGQQVVFAVQCLISKECHEEWDKKLEEFDEAGDPLGFILEISGPWPPYHFSRLINEEETMGG